MDYGGHSVVEACFVVASEKSSPCGSKMWYASVVIVVDDEIYP
jgi:hypothetical protein